MKIARICLLQHDSCEVDIYLNGQVQKRENSDSGYEIARLVGDQPCTITLVDTAEQVAELEKAKSHEALWDSLKAMQLSELDDLLSSIDKDGWIHDSDQFAPQMMNAEILAKVLKSYEVMRKAIKQTLKDHPNIVMLSKVMQADVQVDEWMGGHGD